MLVIHPKDKTTAMLSALYDGLEAQVIIDYRTTKEMGRLLHHSYHATGTRLRQRTFFPCG